MSFLLSKVASGHYITVLSRLCLAVIPSPVHQCLNSIPKQPLEVALNVVIVNIDMDMHTRASLMIGGEEGHGGVFLMYTVS